MKSTKYLGLLAGLLMMGLTACDDDEIYVNPPIVDNANNIVVNPYPNWDKCLLPTVIEDLSSYPAALQEVIRERFPVNGSYSNAAIIFANTGALTSNSEQIMKALERGAFLITPEGADVSSFGITPQTSAPGDAGGMTVTMNCFRMGANGSTYQYVWYDEPEVAPSASGGESSMTESEWRELIEVNKKLSRTDGGAAVTDYDNDWVHNENYFHTRMDPFVAWLSKIDHMAAKQVQASPDYDHLKANLETEGQFLTYNYPFSINAYIDKATFSDPDYLYKSGSISMDFHIFPVYIQSANGEDKAGDYYGVVSTITPHNQSMWGPYVGEHGWTRNRIYGFWFDQMDVETSLVNSDGSPIDGLVYYNRPIPENPNSSKSYSEGTSVTLTGTMSAGATSTGPTANGQYSCGVTISSSTNYTLQTINFSLDSSSPTAKYHYWSENVKLTDDWDDWAKINQNFPAPVRTEFSGHSNWVWHVPSSAVKDGDTKQFSLRVKVKLVYATWYHWRGSVEYDSNKATHTVNVPEKAWTLSNPNRTPWGFIRLRNASSNEMAHVKFYKSGEEDKDPVAQLTTSYGKGDEARIGLVEGTYSVIWDIIDGDTNVKLGTYIYRDVKVHQGKDEDSATIRISSVDGEKIDD